MTHTFTSQLKHAAAVVIFLCAGSYQVYSQTKKEKDPLVKVKITTIIDGEKTVVEKMVPESQLSTLSEVAKDAKGKNVQVYVSTVDDDKADKKDKKQEKHCYSYSYNYTGEKDKDTKGKSKRIIIEKDGAEGNIVDIDLDSIMKRMNLSFDFNFDAIGEDNKNATAVIISNDGKTKKKVIVKTIVRVEDVKEESTATGVKKEEMKAESFSFFPNPTVDGKFNLEFESESDDPANVTITDINGKEVYKEVFKGKGKQKKEIDLGSNKGTFILNLQQGKKSISRKIIVE